LAAAAFFALLLSGCKGGSAPRSAGAGTSGRDEVLVWAHGADASGLDPAQETDGESLNIAANIFDGLVRFKTGGTEIEPSLAEKWDISPDGKTYTFHLRAGVKFTDGTPVNADAVVFSLERQRDENHPAHKLASQFVYWGSMDMNTILESVEKKDDATVVMKLKHPEAPFLADLAMQFAMIVSPDAVLKAGRDFSHHPVGSGAYKLVEWQAGQKLVLEANNDWWGGKPKVKRVIWTVIKDNSSRTQAYLAGNIDGFEGINPFELQKIKDAPHTQVLTQAGMNVFYLAMNMDKKPFDSLKVRQAFAFAINKERIVKNFYGGTATVAATMLPPSLWGHDDSLQPYAFDPDKAKALLKEAGFPGGFEAEFWYFNAPRPYCPAPEKVAAQIQQDLAQVGIKAKLVTFDWTTYLEKTQKGEHAAMLIGWSGDNGDPDNFLYTLLSTASAKLPAQNYAFFRDPEVDGLLNKAKFESDLAKRTQYYIQAQKLIYERAPVVPLAHNLQIAVASDRIQGLRLSPDTRKRWEEVTLLPQAR
jgi:peptide/nickel transport system substrate-binding protein